MEYKIDCKSVGARIKARKLALQMTVSDLYEKSGVPEDTINNIVYGRTTDPRIDSLARIAVALDTTLDYIVFGTQPSAPIEDTSRENHAHRSHVDDHSHISKEHHDKDIASLIESHDRHIKDMKEAHEREIRAILEHGRDLRKTRNFWRMTACALIMLLIGILVWFIWDILHLDQGLIRRIQSLNLIGKILG